MGVIGGLVFVVLLAAIPAVAALLVLDFIFPLRRRTTMIGALFIAGALPSGLLMMEDAEQGFCCREYPATYLTELGLYIPLALVMALFAWPIAAIARHLKRRIFGPKDRPASDPVVSE